MKYPDMHQVQQRFDTASIQDIEGTVRSEFSKLKTPVKPGQRVAVAVGSRGIHNLQPIVTTVVSCLKNLHLEPFVIPAMGSHGGATADGQFGVLEGMKITEDNVGAPIVSSMDVVSFGKLESGTEVFFSKDAFEADHVVAINRVKPHTLFRRPVESGLCKMLVIGCGKHKGAESIHAAGVADALVPAARRILEKAPILCGLAVVENANGGTQTMELVDPQEFVDTDQRLLEAAWKLFPQVPLDDLDVLIIDEIGKDISGGGMDPNITGFWRRDGGPRKPDYRVIVVLDITEASHGNAQGLGWADLTTQHVKDKIDFNATYMNAITAGVFRGARLPITLENDRAVMDTVFGKIQEPDKARMVRIKNTLNLDTFWASAPLVDELREKEDITVNTDAISIEFNDQGQLMSFS